MKPLRKAILQDLVWPAAAGNVAWSFVTIAVTDWSTSGACARLLVLALFAWYLGFDWSRIPKLIDEEVKSRYFIFDLCVVFAIVVFAIAISQPPDRAWPKAWIETSLAMVFLVAIVGHLTGVWETTKRRNRSLSCRLAGANALGVLMLGVSHWAFGRLYPWNLVAALLSVLVVWWCLQRSAQAQLS